MEESYSVVLEASQSLMALHPDCVLHGRFVLHVLECVPLESFPANQNFEPHGSADSCQFLWRCQVTSGIHNLIVFCILPLTGASDGVTRQAPRKGLV